MLEVVGMTLWEGPVLVVGSVSLREEACLVSRESRIVLVLVCVARSGKGVSLREGECSCERGRVFLGAGRHVLRGGPSFREAQCHWRRCIFV